MIRNQRLYLRGTLPPKPGCLRTSAHQQEISLGYLGIRANPVGGQCGEEARRLGVALQERSFDWREYLKPQTMQKLGLELWDKYTAYKEKTVARTTLLSTYAKTRVKLVKWGGTHRH
ncbi:hypothetical protein LQF76_08115 [Gloeomargaritales cyanobacterium VI4D9]|nr:hypothetical protein LQF76_08115 [Gloeomargaritales cyanobacterium VI4D9]